MQDTATLRHLKLQSALVLTSAIGVRASIVQALDEDDAVHLDLSAAIEIDVSFLQILCAAHKTATQSRKTLTIEKTGSELLIEQMERCGLSTTAIPPLR